MDIQKMISEELSVKEKQVAAAVELLDAGNTVPFIARYRKEATGGLDDEALRRLSERLTYLRNLEKRKEEVRALIAAQGQLTDEIDAAIDAAQTVTETDDIYRPFRPKRKTRASVARERGLAPLAELISSCAPSYNPPIEKAAEEYVDEEKEVPDVRSALAGACDIIAEEVSDNAEYRQMIRSLTSEWGSISSKLSGEDGDGVYTQYYEYTEKISALPPHRYLAMNRGENEGALKISVEIGQDIILNALFNRAIADCRSPAFPYMASAVTDSYARLIAPSIEREIRADLFDRACVSAIGVFSDNLRHLLLGAPLKGKCVLGYDPGYRTGCKLAVVDKTGRVLDTAVIYPTKPREDIAGAERTVSALIKKYGVDVVAIGNGTASGESENFIASLLCKLDCGTKYIMVSEAGASVYSASKAGAEEFPDFDVTQRSAVSIARRLQDPLAELVKIDPKSIGVGQYQHDMKEAQLDEALDGVVEYCVNAVGVDLNTASYMLLSHVAGINAASAKNIVKYREENGEFARRADVLKVPRVGARAYEQCAGFLRVPGSAEALDNTGVHPESYDAAKRLMKKYGYAESDMRAGLSRLRSEVERDGKAAVAAELGIGEPTLDDMIGELEKPGRDVRDALPAPQLRERVISLEDLKVGMTMTGVVRNVVDFGAFVDIGVHQDGLVHISRLSDSFVKHPSDVVSVGDTVNVRVVEVDTKRKRIALSMKSE
jgi:uncharacterized protein